MRILLTFLCLLAFINGSKSQGLLNKDTSGFAKKPVFILKFQELTQVEMSNLNIDDNDIQDIKVLKSNTAKPEFGSKAKNSVIIITLKANVDVLTINQLFDRFNIQKNKRKLNVFIDSTIAYKPEIALFSEKRIRNVIVSKEKETGINYINIITTNPLPPFGNGTFKIRN